jgi:hypothetical protein
MEMSNSVLMKAHNQWSSRPADERFGSLAAMHERAMEFRTAAAVAKTKENALRAIAVDDDLRIIGNEGKAASLTNWTFGQVAQRAGAPASYLKDLPARLAADCLNEGLYKNRSGDGDAQLLLSRSGKNLTARAITSDKYSRIWNSDITKRLLELEGQGTWRPAPAAFDGSRGLYLGDRDMFAFLVDNERRIFEKGPGGGLSRGFFCWNSEVGYSAFGVMTFLYEYVCGNHRVWGVQNINELRVIHIGNSQDRKAFDLLKVELRKYSEASAAEDEARIAAARQFEIAATKDDVLNAVFGLKVPALTRKIVGQAYDVAEKRVDWYGSPRSAWGMAGGITEIARDLPNANDRHALDVAATKVMEMAF